MAAIDTNAKVEKARALFLEGYNCAQAVYAAFAPDMGLSEKQALRAVSGMGGGMGGLRLTCGAVSSMAMVLSSLEGYDEAKDAEGKKRLYARIQDLHKQFMDTYGTSNCAELLKASGVAVQAMPADRTPEYYRKRPCVRYVEACAKLLAEGLNGK